jgi:hypothetical protein
MMPLWLDMLRTPMAAPETAGLRRLRLVWQLLCLALAASIVALGPLRAMVGRAAPCMIAVLLALTLLATLIYLRRKHRVDTIYLAALGEGR